MIKKIERETHKNLRDSTINNLHTHTQERSGMPGLNYITQFLVHPVSLTKERSINRTKNNHPIVYLSHTNIEVSYSIFSLLTYLLDHK